MASASLGNDRFGDIQASSLEKSVMASEGTERFALTNENGSEFMAEVFENIVHNRAFIT